jgi:hypothetical protein
MPDVIEEPPSPEHEWLSLEEVFGTERLAALLAVSPPSLTITGIWFPVTGSWLPMTGI